MIDSMANINENKNFICIEYSKIERQIIFGIKIYKIEDDVEFMNKVIFEKPYK